MTSFDPARKGILSAGNWVVDYVKIIDHLPEKNMLASITGESAGLGGAPHNVLVGLACLDASLPLYAGGMIGNDPGGDLVIEAVDRYRIDRRHLFRTDQAPTSHTFVMTESGTGARTFFHNRGANALLGPEHFFRMITPARIFHLGYLLLLDRLDVPDSDGIVAALPVFRFLQDCGYRVSLDVISEDSDRYRDIVVPCLPWIDYLIVNETEAGRIAGIPLRHPDGTLDDRQLPRVAGQLLESGVRDTVVIHFPEGGYAANRSGESCRAGCLRMNPTEIKGSVGAGDAFCAGMLYALHEGWPLAEGLRLANANAAVSLTHPTSTGAARSLNEVRSFQQSHLA